MNVGEMLSVKYQTFHRIPQILEEACWTTASSA